LTKTKANHKKDLTIITTHINADFDALASMLAAQKLYPDSMAVFPGSQEKNLRNFFIKSMVYLFNMADIKDIDLDSVKKLVLVDTEKRRSKFHLMKQRSCVSVYMKIQAPLLFQAQQKKILQPPLFYYQRAPI
jgi:tRNA nucleotidyltransferase (CCA-adding enzyme)